MEGYAQGISFFEKIYLRFLRWGWKLVVILENKGVQNLKSEKNVSIQEWSSKLIFFWNEKESNRFISFFK